MKMALQIISLIILAAFGAVGLMILVENSNSSYQNTLNSSRAFRENSGYETAEEKEILRQSMQELQTVQEAARKAWEETSAEKKKAAQ